MTDRIVIEMRSLENGWLVRCELNGRIGELCAETQLLAYDVAAHWLREAKKCQDELYSAAASFSKDAGLK